jgi:hypothetical protein
VDGINLGGIRASDITTDGLKLWADSGISMSDAPAAVAVFFKALAESSRRLPVEGDEVVDEETRTPETDEAAPQCGFHAQNPASGKLAQCVDPAETTVIVAAVTPDGTFGGVGAETLVCNRHGRELVDTYKAVPVPDEEAP